MDGRCLLELEKCRFEFLGGAGEYDWNWSGPAFTWYLYWFESAGAVVNFNGTDFSIEPNRLLLISPGTVVYCRLSGGRVGHLFMHLHLFFPYDLAQHGAFYAPISNGISEQLLRLKSELLSRVDRLPGAPTMFLAQSIALSAFSTFSADFWPSRNLDAEIVKSIVEMEQYPEREYSNESLSAQANMSESTFLRRFKRATNRTPHRFLLDKRLERARSVLSSTELNLDEVAELCGFNDRFSLTRQFKAQFVISPQQFRQVYRDRI